MVIRRAAKWFILLVIWLSLLNCRRAVLRPVVQPESENGLSDSYLDLVPGWRLRVVTPLLRSGERAAEGVVTRDGPNGLTAKASPDFLGFEMQYYAVEERGRGGLKVRFQSGVTNQLGVQTSETAPLMNYFPQLHRARYLRLIYLLRASGSDHDMAILWAVSKDDMD